MPLVPSRARRTAPAAAVGLLLALTACGAESTAADGADATPSPAASAAPTSAPSPSPSPSPSPPPGPVEPPDAATLETANIALQEIAFFHTPTHVVEHDGALYVTERTGRLRVVRDGQLDPNPLLDISEEVGTEGEGGMLGLAFSPDGTALYLSYTDRAQDSRVVEYAWNGGALDPASRRDVLVVDQPAATHNGGHIAFGPDGMLWIGLGDGGNMPSAARNAQDLSTLLGSMLRIDPAPSGDQPYTVPADNPFVGRPDARPEIWALGLRNPWRWSFDDRGRLWIGDVGQYQREEITVLAPDAAGANLGWPAWEGTRRHLRDVAEPAGAVPPAIEYPHDGPVCSVVGGYVYTGQAIPALRGAYVHGEFCGSTVHAVSVVDGQVVAERDFDLADEVPPGALVSFGQGADGELYLVSMDGPVYRIVAG